MHTFFRLSPHEDYRISTTSNTHSFVEVPSALGGCFPAASPREGRWESWLCRSLLTTTLRSAHRLRLPAGPGWERQGLPVQSSDWTQLSPELFPPELPLNYSGSNYPFCQLARPYLSPPAVQHRVLSLLISTIRTGLRMGRS